MFGSRGRLAYSRKLPGLLDLDLLEQKTCGSKVFAGSAGRSLVGTLDYFRKMCYENHCPMF
jgi:hypothetical protein